LQTPSSALVFAVAACLLLVFTWLTLTYTLSHATAVDDKGKSSGGSIFGGVVSVSTTVITNGKSSTSCTAGESRNEDNQCVFRGPCPSGTITMRHNFDKTGRCFRKA
jgi:hypothetical protein